MRPVILVVIALLLAGCASPQMVWNKPGATAADFRRDNYDCVQQSRTSWSGGGTGLIGLSLMVAAQQDAKQQANALYKMCMEARGYTGHEKQDGETVFSSVSPPKERLPMAPPQPVASPPLAVPQQVAQPPVTPPSSVPQLVSYQAERPPVASLPQPQRKAKLAVVQVQRQYDPAPLLSAPDTHAEKRGVVYSGVNLKVLEEREAWLSVESPLGRWGWILREWVQE